MIRVVALAVVALMLFPGCGFFDGWRVGVEQGSGGINSTTRPGGFDTDELRFTVGLEKDIGGRLASRAATGRHQARIESLLAPPPSEPVETSFQRELIEDLNLQIGMQRGQIVALETERDELREAVKAHHDEGPLDQSDYTIGSAALILLGFLGEMLRRSRKHD